MKNKELIIIALLLIIGSFFTGYFYGVYNALDYVVDVGFALLKHNKIEIDIDREMIKLGVLQYKNNIGGCLFTENASIHGNTWNKA
jgi:hypothetical protein